MAPSPMMYISPMGTSYVDTKEVSYASNPPRQQKIANPPSTTLFLAHLDRVTNDELLGYLKYYVGGFKNHKFTTDKSRNRVAFAEFESEEAATAAIGKLAVYKEIQVDYAKNPLNKRKGQ